MSLAAGSRVGPYEVTALLGRGGMHGFENIDGSRAIVMELVEGPTLAERIARGPLPVDEALAVPHFVIVQNWLEELRRQVARD